MSRLTGVFSKRQEALGMMLSLDAAGVSTVLTSSGKLLSEKYLGELGKCGRKLAPTKESTSM